MMNVKIPYVLLLVISLISCAEAASLPPSVLTALNQAHIPLANIGIEVREANSRKSLIRINAAQPMNPASTMKLLTTYAGLELLGPANTWKTEAWLDGKLNLTTSIRRMKYIAIVMAHIIYAKILSTENNPLIFNF